MLETCEDYASEGRSVPCRGGDRAVTTQFRNALPPAITDRQKNGNAFVAPALSVVTQCLHFEDSHGVHALPRFALQSIKLKKIERRM
jgi:hypothetical protein